MLCSGGSVPPDLEGVVVVLTQAFCQVEERIARWDEGFSGWVGRPVRMAQYNDLAGGKSEGVFGMSVRRR